MLNAKYSRRSDPVLCRLLRPVGTGFLGRQDGMQRISFLPRPELHDAVVPNIFNQPFQNLTAKIGARHLPPAKENRRFDLVSILQKTQNMILLRLVVMVVHINAKLHFLDHDLFLVLLGLALFLLLLIQKFTVVHDAADWRGGGGRNLDQVKVLFAGHFESFEWGQDPDLLALVVNHADFPRTNAVIDADKTFIDTNLRALWQKDGKL